MDQEYELEKTNGSRPSADETEQDENVSVDDFIRQLEEKEKDLHITSDTSIIEIAEAFDDDDLPMGLADALAAGKAERTASAALANEGAETVKLEKKVAELTAVIAKMEADQAEMFKNSQRRARDHEALKARAERERKETFQKQIANMATLMLPALDNLLRALESAEDLPEANEGHFSHFYAGIALVGEQITEILSKMGIRAIQPVGEEFDPHFHEAVATEETDESPENTVTAELLRGYIAGEQVIRHSMVKVAKPLKPVPRPDEEISSSDDPTPPSDAADGASDPAAE